jgi:hypothetical protein
MKFYATLILPLGIDVTDDAAIEASVAQQMKPFEMWQDDELPGEWDYYECCTKAWLEQRDFGSSSWTTALPGSQLVVFPAETLTRDDVTLALVSPQPAWFRRKGIYESEDPTWPYVAIEICRKHQGHHAVVLMCHG